MRTVISAVILFGGLTHKISLEPEYYYKFFITYLGAYLQLFVLCGVAMLVFGIFLLTIAYKKSK